MAPTAAEASIIAEIITGVNKKIREENGEDSSLEDEPELPSNRGNKLKRKSVYAHEGQLYGNRPYKKKINHAGYERYILGRKPKRYDLEGYQLESDEEDSEADEDAAERNPYHGIDVQGLLMPLTAASELWKHPGMSQAYSNEILVDMVQKANEMLRKEKSTLYLVKELATKFRGDHTYIPCGAFFTDQDKDLFDVVPLLKSIRTQVTGEEEISQTPEAAIAVNIVAAEPEGMNGTTEEGTQAEDIAMADTNAAPPHTADGAAEAISSVQEHPTLDADTTDRNRPSSDQQPSGEAVDIKQEEPQAEEPDSEKTNKEKEDQGANGNKDDDMEEDSPAPRMVTRGAAAAANGTGAAGSQAGDEAERRDRSNSPPVSLVPVHPLFIPPTTSIPDRDLGLPPPEAEDTRKLLNVFVQKQEEVVRGCERMYEAFLRANRLRNTVYRWSRAEGHVGEMSDGEDWVDQDEWGLDGPLRKGAAEGEEETRDDDKRGKGRRRGAA